MKQVYTLQRQQRKRGPLTAASFSFTDPTHLFASTAFSSPLTLSPQGQEHLTYVAQFKHAFDRISIYSPVPDGDASYKGGQSDMQQAWTQLSPLQRKEAGRQPISLESAPLQRVAQTSPEAGDTVYTVQPGDSLSEIAAAHGTTWQVLAQHNQIANPDLIDVGQQLNIPGSQSNDAPQPASTPSAVSTPSPVNTPQPAGNVPEHNTANLFPPGQCTWWANERYQQLTGYYVPWTTNSNADQWTARAHDFGWRVSDQPSVGAIIDFQAGVQLASEVGHVAIVEKINGDGSLTTSNMNVLGQPGKVVDLTNHPGPGVTFITYQ